MTHRPLFPAMVTLATICAGCLSQTVPPSVSAGAVLTATSPGRLQSAARVATELRGEIVKLLGGPAEWPVALPLAERVPLNALYQARDHIPLWTDPVEGPTARAREGLALLHAATDDG